MKVYILSSPDNIYFAERLLADIPNVKIISRPLPDEKTAEMKNSIEKSIASADTVLIMIDKDFEKNAQLNAELDIALTNVEKNRNHSILSIVIGNAVVPTDLQGLSMPCVKCNSTSEKDLYETKTKIMRH